MVQERPLYGIGRGCSKILDVALGWICNLHQIILHKTISSKRTFSPQLQLLVDKTRENKTWSARCSFIFSTSQMNWHQYNLANFSDDECLIDIHFEVLEFVFSYWAGSCFEFRIFCYEVFTLDITVLSWEYLLNDSVGMFGCKEMRKTLLFNIRNFIFGILSRETRDSTKFVVYHVVKHSKLL